MIMPYNRYLFCFADQPNARHDKMFLVRSTWSKSTNISMRNWIFFPHYSICNAHYTQSDRIWKVLN